MDFKDRLKEMRQEKQFTQKELANALHLSNNTICEYEKGRAEPNLETLKKMSKLFECNVDYLIGNSDDPTATLRHGDFTMQETHILLVFSKLPTNYQEYIIDSATRLQQLSDSQSGK